MATVSSAADDPAAYLPIDRLRALVHGVSLPENTYGAALFADISGFTALTSLLTRALGLRRGAEELPGHLDRVYHELIERVHQYGGSVIGFAGDAMTCWFDRDDGLQAVACAEALQAVMVRFRQMPLPGGGSAELSLKVAVATGPVRRMVVGDPAIQLNDVIAGTTLERLAAAEGMARSGDIVLDEATVRQLGSRLRVREWRQHGQLHFAVINGIEAEPQLGEVPLDARGAGLQEWLLPAVHQRLQAGQGEFLTELRPVVAVFVGFGGIDYDADSRAAVKLDAFVTRVQREAHLLHGALLQVTVGDKGNYLYLTFGAPVSNEDDARRAVTVARKLLQLPQEMGFISEIRIGMSQGTMRTGAYGGHSRRTYGVLGDETNMAARLMGVAANGQLLASRSVVRATGSSFDWNALEPVLVKGRTDRLPVYEPKPATVPDATRHLQPLFGRGLELQRLNRALQEAKAEGGQLLRVTGEAGIGKTSLLAAFTRTVAEDCMVAQGQADPFEQDTAYSAWRQVFTRLLGLEAPLGPDRLRGAMDRLAPDLLPRLPLLAAVFGLAMADNQLTASLQGELRKTSREALLLDLLKRTCGAEMRNGRPVLLVLENEQWFDPLSRDLLAAAALIVQDLPLLLIVSSREGKNGHAGNVRLQPLNDEAALELLQHRSRGRPLEGQVTTRLLQQAAGNPYYLEELAGFLAEPGRDAGDAAELPDSLHSLVLSRIDRLSELQKATLKAASVFGRSFRLDWLSGYYPQLGGPEAVRAQASELARLEFLGFQGGDRQQWLFRQPITRDVSYESLPFSVRGSLHERLARFLEENVATDTEPLLELLARHYSYGEDVDKQREYLLRAGKAAQASYANEAALRWYRQVLPLLEPAERADALLRQGQVQMHLGQYDEAESSYRQALTEAAGDLDSARGMRLLGELLEKQGDYPGALDWLERARGRLQGSPHDGELVQVLLAEGGNVLWQQGEYAQAGERLQEALQLARQLEDDQGIARALHGLGNIELYQGDLDRARQLFEESLERRRQSGDSLGIANALNNLGIIASSLQGAARARELFEESLDIRRSIGDRAGTAVALNNVGFMAAESGEPEQAAAMYQESLALRREIGDRLGAAVTLNSLGQLHWRQGLRRQAAACFRDSLQLAAGIGNTREVASAVAGAAALAAGRQPQLAVRLAGSAAGLLKGIGAATEPEVQQLLAEAHAVKHSRLSEQEFAAGHAAGAGLRMEDAVAAAETFLGSLAE